MAIGKNRLTEILLHSLIHGKKDCMDKFALTDETYNRYMREARKEYGDTCDSLNKIKEQFSDDELNLLAQGRGKEVVTKTNSISFDGEIVKFGAFGDSHIGSSYTDENFITSAIEEFKRQGCSFIVHGGDVTEGMSGRDGHVYEITHIGYKAQKEASIRLLKTWEKPMYMISGNHDLWYMKKGDIGACIVEDICAHLPNGIYLGEHEGDFFVNGAKIRLWHGEDTGSYATSYRIQKLIESFTGGEKPNVLFCSHTHKQGYFFERNIHAVTLGAMQKQSAWMRAKRLPAHTGFYVITMCIRDSKVMWFEPRFYPFYQ